MDFDNFKTRIITIIITIVFGILLLLLDSVGVVSGIYSLTSVATIPFRLELRKVSLKANDILGAVSQISEIKKENEKLKQEKLTLIEQVSELEAIKLENENLKEQLSLKEMKIDPWILEARVIRSDATYDNTLQVNVGSSDGVKEGDIAVFGGYAIGVVKTVDKYFCKVILITSNLSNIPVRGQTDRALGLVQGDVGMTLKMIDILPDENIEEGEIVVTSGVESKYPAGLIIGIVSSVNNNPASATQEAYINLQLDFTKLDYIYVIRGQDNI